MRWPSACGRCPSRSSQRTWADDARCQPCRNSVHRSVAVASKRPLIRGVSALSLPALARVTVPPGPRTFHGADVRRDLGPVLSAVHPSTDRRVLTLEPDPVPWMAEPRPLHLRVGQNGSASVGHRIERAAGVRSCWSIGQAEAWRELPDLQATGRWRGPGGNVVRLLAVAGCETRTSHAGDPGEVPPIDQGIAVASPRARFARRRRRSRESTDRGATQSFRSVGRD
jgi:hypothetical protein